MRLHELYPFPEERKNRKRLGRGSGSGTGKTAGKGHKGQNARSGGGVRPGFEGGQMPLARRLPKRGFKNLFREEYEVVNIGRLLAMFDGKDEITLADMYERGVVKNGAAVKILATGEVDKAVTVEAHRFSASAAEKIAKAGGNAKAVEA
ncbi:MAG: 50S ribosomal protein L15 [Pseudodesulfovibrio sp.]|uniref:Large ribosomal subunit protein uL15 n=1 Tax=Pseudodesulfovibrio aespoeensis (strain ATCC 700646 / DSM 10631 / Aspo-2) TaxID=643562 RepID=E6VT82_PSEA9|nr:MULTISPECIES: 50S ribosomal protein L15 [Pseudodesulfovibrio]MBU4243282.1 50S ribosomal protein L15 [Pseudomonadota bacterium]ADU63241.1 ribosomal protein L15 [Pseudodesulfovibrio aespoeensis Aspo-2]MBU4379812.1 50S ribosomal protein L15 [Pseudomonadota bacterium]MBU4475138.1 50S ribosomal protein L15 [Pseudomonadota bacterium]MBU4516188.1 50S ribosomal protein L15 [Pseudomonadota bacterium]